MASSVAEGVVPTPESKWSVPPTLDFPESCNFELLEHMGQLFDVTQDLLCVIGFDGRIKYLNGSWEHVLGYTLPELMATPLREKIHLEDREATLADIEKVRAGVPTKSFENRLRCKDGSYKWFSWSGTASEKQGCFYASGRDITETKESQDSALRLAQALEHSSEMICMTDGEGRAVFANQALLDVSGYRRDEILGKPLPRHSFQVRINLLWRKTSATR
jgi:two-component system NtrC family sensor kinase